MGLKTKNGRVPSVSVQGILFWGHCGVIRHARHPRGLCAQSDAQMETIEALGVWGSADVWFQENPAGCSPMLVMVIRKRAGSAMMILRKDVVVINNANVFNMFQRVDGGHKIWCDSCLCTAFNSHLGKGQNRKLMFFPHLPGEGC